MATTLVNYESALILRQKAKMDTPPEERKALYDDIGGKVVSGLYRQKFDVDLFFYYLDNNVALVERRLFYEKVQRERDEWLNKDLVVDTRESWSQWLKRTKDFKEPPLVPREDLPAEF